MPDRYVSPTRSGRGTGASFEDAAGLDRLNEEIKAAGPGGRVLLRTDMGPYSPQALQLRFGGAPGAPVTIMGVDRAGRPAPALFVGDRVEPWSRRGPHGPDPIRLLAGADHLHFRHLAFERQGTCIRIDAPLAGLTVEDATARNVRRFLDGAAVPGRPSPLSGLAVRRVKVAGYSKGVIRIGHDSSDFLIEDVEGDSEAQDGDDFCMGVVVDGTAHAGTLRRVTMRRSTDTLREYWNGDGFATEEETYDLTFIDCVAEDCTDGGFDLKTRGARLIGCVAERNKRNFRLWGKDTTLENCVSRDPTIRGGSGGQNHVWMAETAVAEIRGGRFTDASPKTVLFECAPGSRLTLSVAADAIVKHPDAAFWTGGGSGRIILA
jgi:hypothetical protein